MPCLRWRLLVKSKKKLNFFKLVGNIYLRPAFPRHESDRQYTTGTALGYLLLTRHTEQRENCEYVAGEPPGSSLLNFIEYVIVFKGE